MFWQQLKAALATDNLSGVDRLSAPQRRTLNAAFYILQTHRAVLLTEALGVGKSYIGAALGYLAQNAMQLHLFVLAPAHLLAMWRKVTALWSLRANFYSYAAASRWNLPQSTTPRLWLVDEAHYLKNASTKRYRCFKHVAALDYICLITATPINTQRQDLRALMQLCGYPPKNNDFARVQLFAEAITPSAYVPALNLPGTPRVERFGLPYALGRSDDWCRQMCALIMQAEYPIVLNTGELVQMQLIRELLMERWLSHECALKQTLLRLKRYYKHCSQGDTVLSRRAFYKIFGLEGIQYQLQFSTQSPTPSQPMLLVSQQIDTALSLLNEPRPGEDPKTKLLCQIRRQIPADAQVIAFTKYADVARKLAHGVKNAALLCADRALYNGLEVGRKELLAQFSQNPEDGDKSWAKLGYDKPKILFCTDILSHGHNLQGASVLIHLDLPMNPASILQREGRIVRFGQRAKTVHIFTLEAECSKLPAMEKFQEKRSQTIKFRQKLIARTGSVGLPKFDYAKLYFPHGHDSGPLVLVFSDAWCFLHPKRVQECVANAAHFELSLGQVPVPSTKKAQKIWAQTLQHERALLRYLPESKNELSKICIFGEFLCFRSNICDSYEISQFKEVMASFFRTSTNTCSPEQHDLQKFSVLLFNRTLPTTYPQLMHN